MKPRPLPEGGTIGVAAASSPFEQRSEIDRSMRWYAERGYHVKLADGVYARDDYVAGDARRRADDLNALFADTEVDVIQMLRGGYGASQIVSYLDFDVIAANPKALIGYSDVTVLHVAIRQRTGSSASTVRASPAWAAPREATGRRSGSCERSPIRSRWARSPQGRTIRTSARSAVAAQPRRSSAAASGCFAKRWRRRGSSTSTAASSSSKTCTARRGTSTGC